MFKIFLHLIGRLFISIFLSLDNFQKLDNKQCIVVANHNSHLDIMILFSLFQLSQINKMKTIVAGDYFSKGLKAFISKIMFNSVSINRKISGRNTIETLEMELKNGYSIIIFPEGTRGRPGIINNFKTGIGQLAIDFPDIPIYSVCISGTEKTLPKGTYIPIPFNIKAKVMNPIYGKNYLNYSIKEGRTKITVDIENLIKNWLKF